VQSIAIKRVPLRCHPVGQCGMAWQPTSLPAVRFTATFLAHAMARAQNNPTNCFSVVGPPVRSWASLLFEPSVWVSRQSKFSNEQIENAARCVRTAAELT
jgi:hypothetical protein